MIRFVVTAALVAAISEPLLAQSSPSSTGGVVHTRRRQADDRVIDGREDRRRDDGWNKNKKKDKKDKTDWKHRNRDNGRYDNGRYDNGHYDNDRDRRDNRAANRRRDVRGNYCLDRNRDGRCDYLAQGSGYCLDRDRDGRCDYRDSNVRTDQRLPDMIRSFALDRGQHSVDQRRWLGDADVRGRYTDWDRNGVPERINWLDGAGRMVQQWVDANRDGHADLVRVYRLGELVRVVQ
jgi:hypothetical protein